MRRLLMSLLLLGMLSAPVSASEYMAPEAPASAQSMMPETESFAQGVWEMVNAAISRLDPDFRSAVKISTSVAAAVILVSFVQAVHQGSEDLCELAGVVAITSLVLLNTNSMIRLASDTVLQISEYGKLLLPVLTAALAAQGGVSTSASLYAGTAVFNAVLSGFISNALRPLVYCYLALGIASAAAGEPVLKHFRDLVKTFSGWCLKMLLTVFTTYMSITGVISGTTDAAALKATKVTISSFVPVVGSILSDASEAVLVSAGMAKNAAGIYGIFAILAIFLVPFLRIGVHYLVLKATFALCGIFGTRRMGELIGDFSTAMGLLLAMTGSACLIQLISTVCFLKGVG